MAREVKATEEETRVPTGISVTLLSSPELHNLFSLGVVQVVAYLASLRPFIQTPLPLPKINK